MAIHFISFQELNELSHMSTALTREQRERTLWMGDIQTNWDSNFVRSLFAHRASWLVSTVTIKRNARKGWKNEQGQRIGFALIEFKSVEIVKEVLSTLNGQPIPDYSPLLFFNFKPNVWSDDNSTAHPAKSPKYILDFLGDPSLELQLEPCSISQLRERLAGFGCEYAQVEKCAQERGGRVEKKASLIKLLCSLHRDVPIRVKRNYTHVRGAMVPDALRSPLLEELRRTNWAPKQRNVTAQQYLVIGVPADGAPPKNMEQYARIWALAGAVISRMAPEFTYSSLAVTKNFIGSPHVDMGDKTPQYAMALGDFSEGGELCVEVSPTEVAVVQTHNRLAKVDGRFPHWVRSYQGERFSLIFYCVTGKAIPRCQAVFPSLTFDLVGSTDQDAGFSIPTQNLALLEHKSCDNS